MPIYEYEPCEGNCTVCGGRFEIVATMSEPDLTECPTCYRAVRKVVSQAAFALDTKVNYDKAAQKGFATYRKAGKGQYEKIAGQGPSQIDGDTVK